MMEEKQMNIAEEQDIEGETLATEQDIKEETLASEASQSDKAKL